jgi:hypothetical protein
VARTGFKAWIGLVGFVLGCASAKPPPAVVAPPPPVVEARPPVRLVWFPVEARAASKDVVSAANDQLAHLSMKDVTQVAPAPVSLEMAQLTIECIDKTPGCFSKVGRSLNADRMVWADVERGGQGAVTVKVSMFDVAKGAITKNAKRTFPTPKEARDGVAGVVRDALGGAP